MPFRADASAAGTPYLADRLTDELIATLGKVKSLQVPSLSTVSAFKDSTQSLQQIGRSLQVGNLLDATLSVIPDAAGKPERVRVRARLITAGTGSEVWVQEFERSLGEVRALHAEIARNIVSALNITLTPEETINLRPPRATPPEANAAYFLGMHLLSQSSVDVEAVAAFRRAIEIDPNHAGAHAGLARGLMMLGFIGNMTHNAARATATGEARRALELEPDLAEAHAVQADLQFLYDWDWAGADQSYGRAIDLNPSFARARSQYARFLAAAGRPEEATWQADRGVELEPTSASALSTRAMIEYYKRDFPAALASADQAIRLEPQSGSAYFVRARVLAATTDIQNAIPTNERAIQLRGKDAPTSWRAHLLRLRAQAGEQAQVRTDLEALIASVRNARQVLYPTHVAYVHEALGDREAAMQLIERAAADRDPDVLWFAVDPRVDGLRTDPRFMQVIKGLNIPQ
jgi:TolB-like protein